jgi:hypothetical protein
MAGRVKPALAKRPMESFSGIRPLHYEMGHNCVVRLLIEDDARAPPDVARRPRARPAMTGAGLPDSNIALQRCAAEVHLLGNPSHNFSGSSWAAQRALLSRTGYATISRSVSLHQTKFVSRTFQINNMRSRQAA